MTMAAALAASASARAEDGIRVDQLQPAPPDSPFVRADGPHAPQDERVEFSLGLTFDYALRPVQVETQFPEGGGDDIELGIPVRHALLAHVGASLTPVHWLALDVAAPFGLAVSGDERERTGSPAAESPRLGDPRIGVHFRPLDTLALGVLVGARFWVPVGSPDAYLGDKNPRFEVDGAVTGATDDWLGGCSLGVSPLFFVPVGRSFHDGDRVALACALHAKLASIASVGIEPSLAVYANRDRPRLDPQDDTVGRSFRVQIEPLAAGRLRIGDFRVGLAVGPGFGSAAGTPAFRNVLTIAYVGAGEQEKPPPPPPPDEDLDKILDADDACPKEAGPDSKDPNKRGCPTTDRDADGIADEDDFCPDENGIPHPDPNANGCPDSDNDQLPDPVDSCTTEPGPAPEGCPKNARLENDGFRLAAPIAFDARTNSLTPASRATLEEVAATMRANPKLGQVSVSLGVKGLKPEIADKRAQELFLVFRQANLKDERFEVVIREDLKAGAVDLKLVK
jgi:hypothetical protein